MARRYHTNQPPIDVNARPSEGRRIWLALALIVLACASIITGLQVTRSVDEDGVAAGPYSELRLHEIAMMGGVRRMMEVEAAKQRGEDPGDEDCFT